jgi:hypothetical protein
MKKIFYLLAIFCLTSCGNNDDDSNCSDTTFLPPPEGIYLKLVDTDGMSLIGSTFVQDSFKLSNTNATLYLKPDTFGPQDELFVWFNSINSQETYYLELSETDTDTLNIGYSLRDNECFSFLGLDTFIYNNELLYDGAPIGNGVYPIVKD